MFWKKGGGVVAYLSSDGAAVVWQDGEEEQRVGIKRVSLVGPNWRRLDSVIGPVQ